MTNDAAYLLKTWYIYFDNFDSQHMAWVNLITELKMNMIKVRDIRFFS